MATPKKTAAAKTADDGGTPDNPWKLTTPSGSSEFTAHRDPGADPPALTPAGGTTPACSAFSRSNLRARACGRFCATNWASPRMSSSQKSKKLMLETDASMAR